MKIQIQITDNNNHNSNLIYYNHHHHHQHWKYVKHKRFSNYYNHHHCNNFFNIILISLFFSYFHNQLSCFTIAQSSSSSSSSSLIDDNQLLSSLINNNHHNQHHHNHHAYYFLKPSNFFNEYFDCRFGLIMNELRKLTENNDDENNDKNDKENNDNNTILDDSKRQNSEKLIQSNPNSQTNCPADCDGITLWPETKQNNKHFIFCHEILNILHERTVLIEKSSPSSLQDNDDNLINYHQPIINQHQHQHQHRHNHITVDDWQSMSDNFANHYQQQSKQSNQQQSNQYEYKSLSLTKVSRYCNQYGNWESNANYSICGLDNDKLFLLTTDQLQKIYEIRERMIHSKFTQNIESEKAFIDCIDNVLSLPSNSDLAKPYCERTFDGWTCFNDTPAGEVSYFPCPDFVYGFNSQNQAHKTCTKEGKWRVHHETHVPWTNYTSCVDIPDLNFRNMIIKLYIVGYSISLVALLISITIFVSFKTLSSQTRIRIHKNLFLSFIINNFMWIIWYLVIRDGNILFENGFFCQALHVVLHYFLVCNYFWMFCEGLYLHTILVNAFVTEEKILKWFYMIGWCIPIIFVSAYATFRANSTDAKNCWIDESLYTWILNIPVLISFVLNIFFLINIVRVLVTKLQAVNTADAHHTRKAVRATLILIPLLGLNYILTPFRPETNDSAARIYEIFSAIVLSLQGFCVSMLFCYFNGEVLSVLKKRWNQFLIVRGYTHNHRITSHHGTEISINLSDYEMTNDNYPHHHHHDRKNGNHKNNNNNNNNNNNELMRLKN